MLCNECEKNQATVHVTKIINGIKTETHLCEECAKKQQAFFNNNFSMENLLAGMLNEAFHESYNNALPCKTCGMTFDEFKKVGKFGCSDCVSMFGDRLMSTIKNLQGYDTHIGKIPKSAGKKYRLQKDIENLKAKLRQMVELEKYEDAAVIRDQIKELETGIVSE